MGKVYNAGMAGRVAIVHDWLNGMRGGEKVVEQLLLIYPEADIFTLFFEPERISPAIRARRVHASRLNRNPFIRRHYRWFLPILPRHIEEFDLRGYDLVVSSSHCVAKGAIPAPDALHVCYIHSPMRYAWDQYHAYFPGSGLKKRAIRPMISRLRQWDVTSAQRVDRFIANSRYVARRVELYYRRDAMVIPPPVDTDFFQPAADPTRDYDLLVSALVPYKNIPLVIEAFRGSGRKLRIVGTGTEDRRLRKMAGPEVEFLGFQGGESLRGLYQNARAVVFAGIEDFGIFFVEALACSTPVVAYAGGGVLDIVEPDRHGLLFERQTVDGLREALRRLDDLSVKPEVLRERSLQFSAARFRDRFTAFVREAAG